MTPQPYHIHGNALHERSQPTDDVCREARRATVVCVGKIERSVLRIEKSLARFAATPGPGHLSDRSSAPSGLPGFGTFCEGRR
jgi:hypothetical protein